MTSLGHTHPLFPLLVQVREALARSDTSLLEDMQAVLELETAAAGSGSRADPRMKAVLGYRVATKRLMRLAEEMLS